MARYWVCETCNSRRKGPDKPRRNASVRYCFPCSEKKGTLVERRCPSLDKKREIRKKRKKGRRPVSEAEDDVRYQIEGEDLRDRLRSLVQLRCWKKVFRDHGLPELSIRWSTAYPHGVSGSAHDKPSWKVCMTIGVDASYAEAEETLIHELAHLAVGCEHMHDKEWRAMFRRALFEEWGVLAEGTTTVSMDVNAEEGIASVRSLKRAA